MSTSCVLVWRRGPEQGTHGLVNAAQVLLRNLLGMSDFVCEEIVCSSRLTLCKHFFPFVPAMRGRHPAKQEGNTASSFRIRLC